MLLEFGALSRFSGDERFERAARRAMEALWSRRSINTGLVGETINVTSGAWARTGKMNDVGAECAWDCVVFNATSGRCDDHIRVNASVTSLTIMYELIFSLSYILFVR